jgi:hypothetical protein
MTDTNINNNILDDIEKLKQTTANLVTYNTNLPLAINNYFKIMRNDVDDMRDYLDRLDSDIDRKIIGKQEMHKLKIRVSKVEDNMNIYKIKLLDLEDKVIGIERDLMHLKTIECNEDLRASIKILSEKVDIYGEKKKKPEVDLQHKKLKSTIRNTRYSIKNLSSKATEGTITEKEKVRLEEKNQLLESLLKQI